MEKKFTKEEQKYIDEIGRTLEESPFRRREARTILMIVDSDCKKGYISQAVCDYISQGIKCMYDQQ